MSSHQDDPRTVAPTSRAQAPGVAEEPTSGPQRRPTRIHLSAPHPGGNELKYVEEAFASNWLSSVGPSLDAFERVFAERVGRPAVALSSGTAAVHLGLRLLGVGPGDEVLVSDFTFAASVNPIRYLGATPVLVDSDPESWMMSAGVLAEALEDRVRRGRRPGAVEVVHLYGQSADMDPILRVCERHGVPVLEDAAEAVGCLYRGKPVGSFGAVGAFSFNGNKIITTSGGGILVAARQDWVEKARYWSTQAREPGVAYHHNELGYNYRLSNVLAAIGLGQLEVLDERIRQRRAVAFRYRDAFADLPGITFMPQAPYGFHTNWLSCFLIDREAFGASRDDVLAALAGLDVDARPLWKPMHMQPIYSDCDRYGGEVAESLFERGLCLPSSSNLSLASQRFVIEAVRSVAGRGTAPRPGATGAVEPNARGW